MITENVINPGDTVLEERPYATCLKSQFFGSYCHHCLDKYDIHTL